MQKGLFKKLQQSTANLSTGQDLFISRYLRPIFFINESIKIRITICFSWVSCVSVNLKAKDRKDSPNEAWICQCPQYVCYCHDNYFFARNIDSIRCGFHVLRQISRYCRYFVNYGGMLVGRIRNVRYIRSLIPEDGL